MQLSRIRPFTISEDQCKIRTEPTSKSKLEQDEQKGETCPNYSQYATKNQPRVAQNGYGGQKLVPKGNRKLTYGDQQRHTQIISRIKKSSGPGTLEAAVRCG